jgi:hypothetical protein
VKSTEGALWFFAPSEEKSAVVSTTPSVSIYTNTLLKLVSRRAERDAKEQGMVELATTDAEELGVAEFVPTSAE